MADNTSLSILRDTPLTSTIATQGWTSENFTQISTTNQLSNEVVNGLSNTVVPKLDTISGLVKDEVEKLDILSNSLSNYSLTSHTHPQYALTSQIPTKTSDLTNDSGYVTSADLTKVMKYKGTVTTYSDLPASGNVEGDVWNVVSAYGDYPPGTNYAWTGSTWDPLGGSIDTSVFALKSEVPCVVLEGNSLTVDSNDIEIPSVSLDESTITINGSEITVPCVSLNGSELEVNSECITIPCVVLDGGDLTVDNNYVTIPCVVLESNTLTVDGNTVTVPCVELNGNTITIDGSDVTVPSIETGNNSLTVDGTSYTIPCVTLNGYDLTVDNSCVSIPCVSLNGNNLTVDNSCVTIPSVTLNNNGLTVDNSTVTIPCVTLNGNDLTVDNSCVTIPNVSLDGNSLTVDSNCVIIPCVVLESNYLTVDNNYTVIPCVVLDGSGHLTVDNCTASIPCIQTSTNSLTVDGTTYNIPCVSLDSAGNLTVDGTTASIPCVTLNGNSLTVDSNSINIPCVALDSSGNLTVDSNCVSIPCVTLDSSGNLTVDGTTTSIPCVSLDGNSLTVNSNCVSIPCVSLDGSGNLTVDSYSAKIPCVVLDNNLLTVDGGCVTIPCVLTGNNALTVDGTTYTIPTVNDGTLTIQKNGSTLTSFTANQSGNVTANIEIPTVDGVYLPLSGGTLTGDLNIEKADPSITIKDNDTASEPYVKLTKNSIINGSEHYTATLTLPITSGTLALTSDIPTVNDGALTIQKNGNTVASFTANQSTSVSANIDVPLSVSELINDVGYLTAHQDLSNYYTKQETDDAYVKLSSKTTQDISSSIYVNGALSTTTRLTVYSNMLSDTVELWAGRRVTKRIDGVMRQVNEPGQIRYKELSSNVVVLYFPPSAESGVIVTKTFLSANYAQLSDIPEVPTDLSAFTNSPGYLTAHQSLSAYALTSTVDQLSGEVVEGLSNIVIPKLNTISSLVKDETEKLDTLSSELSNYALTSQIPTVNDGTLTIQRNGSQVTAFTANQSNSVTANISVPTNTNELTNGAGFITSAQVDAKINAALTTTMEYKGTKTTYAQLPTSGNKKGDVWNVISAYNENPPGTNYAWDGSAWDPLGGNIDVSIFATKTELNDLSVEVIEGLSNQIAPQLSTIADLAEQEAEKLDDLSGKLSTYATVEYVNDLSVEVFTEFSSVLYPDISTLKDLVSAEVDKLDILSANYLSGVKMNGSAKPVANNVVDLGTVLTAHQSLTAYALKSSVEQLSGEMVEGLSNQIAPQLSTIADLAEQEAEKLDDLSNSLTGYALTSQIPLSTSQLTNDSGFITGYTETDPIFKNWLSNTINVYVGKNIQAKNGISSVIIGAGNYLSSASNASQDKNVIIGYENILSASSNRVTSNLIFGNNNKVVGPDMTPTVYPNVTTGLILFGSYLNLSASEANDKVIVASKNTGLTATPWVLLDRVTGNIPEARVSHIGYIKAADVPLSNYTPLSTTNTLSLEVVNGISNEINPKLDVLNALVASEVDKVDEHDSRISVLENDLSDVISVLQIINGSEDTELEDLIAGSINFLSSQIPTKTSQLINDSGYLTAEPPLSNYVSKVETNAQNIAGPLVMDGTAAQYRYLTLGTDGTLVSLQRGSDVEGLVVMDAANWNGTAFTLSSIRYNDANSGGFIGDDSTDTILTFPPQNESGVIATKKYARQMKNVLPISAMTNSTIALNADTYVYRMTDSSATGAFPTLTAPSDIVGQSGNYYYAFEIEWTTSASLASYSVQYDWINYPEMQTDGTSHTYYITGRWDSGGSGASAFTLNCWRVK